MKSKIFLIFVLFQINVLILGCAKSDDSPTPTVPKATAPPSLDDALDDPNDVRPDPNNLDEKNRSKLACIESLCGDSYPFAHEYVKKPEQQKVYKEMIEQKLGRKVKLYMGQVIKNEMAFSQTIELLKKADLSQIEFSEEQKGFMLLFYYFSKINKYIGALEYKDGYIFNSEKLKEIDPLLTEDEIVAIQALASVFSSTWTQQQRIDALTINLYIRTLKTTLEIPDKSDEELLKLLAEVIVYNSNNRLAQFINPEFSLSDQNYIIEKAQKLEKLSVLQKIELLKRFNESNILNNFTDKDLLTKFAKINFSKEDLIKKLIGNYSNSLGKLFNQKTQIKSVFASSIDQCQTKLAQSYADIPSSEENQKAQRVLQLIVKKANELATARSNQTLIDELKVEFVLPRSRDESVEDWSDIFDGALKSISPISKFIEAQKYSQAKLPAQLVISLFLKYQNQPELFKDVISSCNRSEPAFLSDAAMPTENKFIASWVTIKNLDYGLGIMAHEIGHIVSKKWPDLFKSQRSCLTNNYAGNDQYVEEDFADLFSSKLITEFKKEIEFSSAANMSCGLSPYKSMNLEELKLDSEPYDSHSSDFYRLFSVASATDTMTKQCKTYLRNYEDKAKIFKSYCSMQ